MARKCHCLSCKLHPCQTKLSPIVLSQNMGFKRSNTEPCGCKSNSNHETQWSVQIHPQKLGSLPTCWGSGDMNMGDHIKSRNCQDWFLSWFLPV